MNIRSLTRGDGAVIGAAVLLLISSFLPFFSMEGQCREDCSVSAWSPSTFPLLPTVHLLALVAAGLFLAGRALPEGRKLLGLGFDRWATVLSVVVGWSAIWSIFSALFPTSSGPIDTNKYVGFGIGAWLTLIFALVFAAAGAAGSLVPALKAPLVPASTPKQPNAYGQQPQGGYGYPGAGAPQPGAQQQPGQPGGFGGTQGGYGYPGGQEQPAQAQPAPGQAQPAQATQQPQAAADPAFQPFWFAVPVARPLFGEDGSPQPVAELAPGTWYLAVEQRGQALVAQTQDGRRGMLHDTSGIQRG
ncbi:DUF5336 domain-containing protein [Streptomyces sp. HNM0574]|uniref:DUF5336 domain-containing protein n=1 Tax=Streptomyces sp. HNM0574 TaxID=2714954 RepID=UPI00146A7F4B|nr:hypothetical protein [Streptomyces sp. HNM0574]